MEAAAFLEGPAGQQARFGASQRDVLVLPCVAAPGRVPDADLGDLALERILCRDQEAAEDQWLARRRDERIALESLGEVHPIFG